MLIVVNPRISVISFNYYGIQFSLHHMRRLKMDLAYAADSGTDMEENN